MIVTVTRRAGRQTKDFVVETETPEDVDAVVAQALEAARIADWSDVDPQDGVDYHAGPPRKLPNKVAIEVCYPAGTERCHHNGCRRMAQFTASVPGVGLPAVVCAICRDKLELNGSPIYKEPLVRVSEPAWEAVIQWAEGAAGLETNPQRLRHTSVEEAYRTCEAARAGGLDGGVCFPVRLAVVPGAPAAG